MRVAGAVLIACIVLGVSAPAPSSAQTSNDSRIEGYAPALSVSRSDGTMRLTFPFGKARTRTLLETIARATGMEVRNLDRAPDDVIFVGFSSEPVGRAVVRILEYAKVDFVLRGGYGHEPPLLILPEESRPTAPSTPLERQQVLDAPESDAAPAWEPIDAVAEEVPLPPDMDPTEFPVSAPPPVVPQAARPATPKPQKQ
jgi:hypothetical protein